MSSNRMVRMLLVAEIRVEEVPEGASPSDVEYDAQQQLDLFREAVLPTENYGITLYRPDSNDLFDFQRPCLLD